ncbi:MAG TPA: hypothetical protein VMT00_02435 [Thermoanaerobaculia bacterium]|nr:hypothetical protein [Thermoanaerobaculia bacterium]
MSVFRCGTILCLAAGAFLANGQPAPRLDRITASLPSDTLQTTLSGMAGAVPASAKVIAIHVDTGHYNITQAAADGSFSMSLFATPGGTLEIKTDPTGEAIAQVENDLPLLKHHYQRAPSIWGAMLHLPHRSGNGIPFAVSGPTFPLPIYYAEGFVRDADLRPAGSVRIEGTFRLLGAAATSPNAKVSLEAGWIALARADGTAAIDQAVFASSVMTPTGFPIERFGSLFSGGVAVFPLSLSPSGDDLAAPVNVVLPIPAIFPPGHYRPVIVVRHADLQPIPAEMVKMTLQISQKRGFEMAAFLPILKIGEPAPASFESTLLLNSFHAGARGVDSVESRGRFSLAPRIAMPAERIVVPRRDAITGSSITYSLEPYIPSLAVSDRSEPLTAPRIPFRFPSGSLSIRLRAPDGSERLIGPAPLKQSVIEPLSRRGSPLENGPSLSTTLRLSTLDPAFNVVFETDGLYTATLDLVVEDVWGNVWTSKGTFEIEVADSLVIDPGLVPGTPFEVGDHLPLEVTLYPPVAADVRVRFRFEGASGPRRDETHFFRTNRFGHGAGPFIPLTEPGEYRIDIAASRAENGRMSSGRMSWGNVVAPRDQSIIVHGRRGIDNLPEPRPQWFFRKQLGASIDAGHTFFPFHDRDVVWLTDETQESGITAVTFQDPQELVAPTLRSIYAKQPNAFPRFVDHSLEIGEGPVFSLSSTTLDAHVDPAQVDYWSYGYRFVERPLVRIREAVVEEPGPFTYWRLQDLYGLQPGNGANGDRTNDFKFQFGGFVARGTALPSPQYAIYGSLHVIVDKDDELGTRVTPPFQGNGGGPDGGPLFTLKGRPIDLFFHPTALRAGTILERGDRITLAGHIAPTVPGKVEATITSPSGTVQTIEGTANRIGHFSDPRQSLRSATEAGVWKARVRVTFDGRTSGGQLTEPFPTGDVLGSRDGEFWFYVVEPTAAPLDVSAFHPMETTSPAGARFVRPADGVVTFTISPPSGLTNIELHTTTTMPGFILEEMASESLIYRYDADRLAQDFPNLDLRDHDGKTGVDTITISFLLSGTDASGTRRHHARQIVIQGEELQMPEQKEAIVKPRRRSVRR